MGSSEVLAVQSDSFTLYVSLGGIHCAQQKRKERECVNLARHFPIGLLASVRAAVTFKKPLIQKN